MTTVDVFNDVAGSPILVGQAHFTRARGRVSTTFLYDTDYLAGNGTTIDPALRLASGAQHHSGMIRAFADSAPDRWGRNLIDKGERTRTRQDKRVPRRLDDVDYLLGVSDDTRQGSLRFALHGHAEFLGAPSRVPTLVSLPELLHAADDLARGDDPKEAVKRLLSTGTAGLGGARPKAAVKLSDGSLGIAKFPHAGDDWNVTAWEATALDLLEQAGIHTPYRRLVPVGNRSALVLRRFDRTTSGERIGYISAMTTTESTDGEQRDYADIADSIRDLSRSPKSDLRELYSRVIANIALGNTDDHLRNHGFLASGNSWTLSPVFDVNPNPDPSRQRSTSIMGADSFPEEVDGLLALAEECDLGIEQARQQIRQVTSALSSWRELALRHGISQRELSLMEKSLEPRLEGLRAAE
ncbi:type II toxin-antitoxin system HipA family toxin [Brevibacterium sp. 50QC2O2]|uniref:type II toxin-antitoxin system HipA family toxin n=1 Tax=Brevibacterium sp. 50QC2O2 TaxID=2968459 RepID=UPI00211CEBC2|nr:type II toxin-antitoxin system HipA family toxin [Brevibacterium sp. 50QC2O2]MCQ9388614.1 type II toxin-antitoxin system HipA family toxin [Brevibacterium sp. 50QC2O2]